MTKKVNNRRRQIYIKQKGKCFYCNKKLSLHSCTLDHATPKSKGGKRTKNNLKLSCKKCNSTKSNMCYDHWMNILPILIQSGYMHMSKKDKCSFRLLNSEIFHNNRRNQIS